MGVHAISLDAIASHPELARDLDQKIRRELVWRFKIVGAALDAAAGAEPQMAQQLLPPPPFAGAGEDSELLDCEAAAEFLACSVRWVKMHAQEVGGLRIGRIWRFPVSKLREYLRQRINAPYNRKGRP